ncbi:T9SS type A sorting domain-containing protein, partial [bacterium]|nr:T9SS type A sorting domain-containing protein [bacterium]
IFRSIELTPDGGYILAGYTGVINPQYPIDFWLVKTDSFGDTLWTRTFGSSSDDYGYSVQLTSDGGYIIAGSYAGNFGVIKTDSNGDSLWGQVFGGAGLDACYYVAQMSDDGYILGGYTESFGAGDKDAWLLRTDANGDSLWSRTFGGMEYEDCHSILQTSDGGYIFAGRTRSFGAGICDFWLVKTGPEPAAAEPSVTLLPSEYMLFQNYPNPFNPSTRITYDLTNVSYVSLQVFDVVGREVQTLVDEVQVVGSHSITFNGKGLSSGIYFYRLRTGDVTTIKKMVLLK